MRTVNPERTDQPPAAFAVSYELISGSFELTSEDAGWETTPPTVGSAWDSAVTNRGDLTGAETTTVSPGSGFELGVDSHENGAWLYVAPAMSLKLTGVDMLSQKLRMHFRFYTATCYLKAYWTQTVTIDGTPTATDESWTWGGLSNAGLCLPDGWDSSDVSTWPNEITGTFEPVPGTPVAPPDPGGHPGEDYAVSDSHATSIILSQFRWSFVNGYVPPSDGSANGFPA